jgi:hypothetical protein
VFLIKTNRHGRTVWMKTYGGIGNDRGYSVQQTRDGGYIIIGDWGDNSEVLLIKTDRHGKVKALSSDDLWFEKLFERFPNAFPLLRQLRG